MSKEEIIDKLNKLYRKNYPLTKKFFRTSALLEKELEKPKPHSVATKKKIAELEKKIEDIEKESEPITKEIRRLQAKFDRLVNQDTVSH